MQSGKLHPILIQRGLSWPGVIYACFSDTAGLVPAEIEGWQPAMTAMAAPGKGVKIEFSCTLNDAMQVEVAAKTGAETLALPLGKFTADLCFVNDAGLAVGPYGRAQVTVEDVNTVPEETA